MNHKHRLKFDSELRLRVKTKMLQMQDKFNMALVEVQFMEQAVDDLCSFRQTLMYTYVFAFYNQNTQQLMIFEDNQRDLQKAVEMLSEYLEQETDREEDHNIQTKVLHLSNYCQNRRKVLIDHILEGNEKEWWKYSSN
jgi:ariadne-1